MSPTGEFKSLKGRIVGGGHRQDHAMFTDSEIFSPIVSLTALLSLELLLQLMSSDMLTLDHKAAYLNAAMFGNTESV